MNRLSFMISLENRLRDVYEEDKKEALQYYEEIFNDIGLTNDDDVPTEFQDVDGIARDIKNDSRINRVMAKSKKETNMWKNIVIIILAIFAAPIALPIALGALMILLVPLFILVTLVLSFIFAAGAAMVAIISSILTTGVFPLGIFGIMLILIGLSILLFLLTKYLIIKIKDFTIKKLDERKEKKAKEQNYEK